MADNATAPTPATVVGNLSITASDLLVYVTFFAPAGSITGQPPVDVPVFTAAIPRQRMQVVIDLLSAAMEATSRPMSAAAKLN